MQKNATPRPRLVKRDQPDHLRDAQRARREETARREAQRQQLQQLHANARAMLARH